VLGYGGIGIFIHPRARIGRRCILSQFISIGGMKGHEEAPIIGDYVRVGTGARILGPVRIGDFAVIGPNAVVVRDVPAGTVVFGVPARVVRTMSDPVAEYEHDTGRLVLAEDRERAPKRRAQPPAPREQPATGRNEIRPGQQPDLFDDGMPPFVPDQAPAPTPSPGSDSQPTAETRAVIERSVPESHPS
jgi:serine O-acetyltransferase